MSDRTLQKNAVQLVIPTHALVIQSGEHVRFEANGVDEMTELIALWKREVLPHTFDDIDPTPAKAARASGRTDSGESIRANGGTKGGER